jgi:ABC-type polysaccharide/polyol phosphate export permease
MASAFSAGLRDFFLSIAAYRIWSYFGYRDIRARYRRTLIGPFWTVGNQALLIIMMSVVYANLWSVKLDDFMPFLSAGTISWFLIATSVNESCVVFVTAQSVINNTSQPILIHVVRVMWRNILVFLHFLIVHAAVFLYFKGQLPTSALWLFLTLPLVGLNMFWIGTLIGLGATRFRDVTPIIQNVVTGFFFVTPIFWPESKLKPGPVRTAFVDWNPFYHLIEMIRPFLLGNYPSMESVIFVLGMSVVGVLVTIITFGRVRDRIAYWI